MKRRLIQFLLLSSLFFNIVHASVLALEEDCHHDSVSEYILDSHVDDTCGDLCDMHYMFHFIAIISPLPIAFDTDEYKVHITHKALPYTPPFKQTDIKPPIA